MADRCIFKNRSKQPIFIIQLNKTQTHSGGLSKKIRIGETVVVRFEIIFEVKKKQIQYFILKFNYYTFTSRNVAFTN